MIYVDNRQEKIEVSEILIENLKKVIQFTLMEEEVDVECEVSLLFVDNEEIREINNETRSIDRETDVLSFPMLEYQDKKVFKQLYKNYEFSQSDFDGNELVLGDIVLSLEKALEQSKEFNHSYEREASYLVVHSVLHLLGYDHIEEEDKVIMRSREEEILNKLNITR
ncbi:rRNA maturation RNase YbeY [Clostridium saccharobutylicum]|uniref:Endoribonuclease YbeY n=1 Tax=Clostridium saccharobutylicum DSM 13864 TaxID=1345695 RepID=U5MND7_CLOSA|nr:rRNA maturation RNase YbeY [Clostridium saccharobutylicum]AGX42105.1 endoribonuclease YbeY [Clostridium saccharobutylicum DSM 13864]AQR89382.1 endoribonuclease YbeY [Clostridium saccharobutylicum]AQR99284.1 endoribonuclease YbeY [Clostridium saccharobutylicum]AQS09016.1 endoribonuclease YbeY [Clostridium saccharobutylicum]AQS13270.1 endoribonuclease YbeY [Clostridium saccharobutylicum]